MGGPCCLMGSRGVRRPQHGVCNRPIRDHCCRRGGESEPLIQAHVAVIRGFECNSSAVSVNEFQASGDYAGAKPRPLMCRIDSDRRQNPCVGRRLGQSQVSQRNQAVTVKIQNLALQILPGFRSARWEKCGDGTHFFIHEQQPVLERMPEVKKLQPLEPTCVFFFGNRPAGPGIRVECVGQKPGSGPPHRREKHDERADSRGFAPSTRRKGEWLEPRHRRQPTDHGNLSPCVPSPDAETGSTRG